MYSVILISLLGKKLLMVLVEVVKNRQGESRMQIRSHYTTGYYYDGGENSVKRIHVYDMRRRSVMVVLVTRLVVRRYQEDFLYIVLCKK